MPSTRCFWVKLAKTCSADSMLCPPQANDDFDAGHFHAVRRLGQVGHADAGGRHVDALATRPTLPFSTPMTSGRMRCSIRVGSSFGRTILHVHRLWLDEIPVNAA